MPKPHSGETHDEWIGRCMSDASYNATYPRNDQRDAVCQSLWDNKKEK